MIPAIHGIWQSGSSFVGPLDGIADAILCAVSPGARLLSSWTGALQTIRRDSDDDSEAFSPGADGLLNASAVSAFLGGANPFTVQLTDQSGNGLHFGNTTADNQPAVDLADANWNNVATCQFDGINDSLTAASSMDAAGFLVGWKTLSVSIVSRVFANQFGSGSIAERFYDPGITTFYSGNPTIELRVPQATLSQAEFIYDGPDSLVVINGSETAFPDADGYPFNTRIYTLGDYTNNGGQNLNMSLAYFVALNRVLTAPERASVRAALSAVFQP